MTALKFVTISAALILLATIVQVQAQSPPPLGKPIFCDHEYALCIKALCKPIIDKYGQTNYANCECDVRSGWSMGPQSCSQRQKKMRNGRTLLISTYSNLYNKTEQTMSCNSTSQIWAWCYGAPCTVDRADPTKTCTCPVYPGAMQTLGGKCGTADGGCNSLWSAATPKADDGANKIFAAYMTANGYPHNGPAGFCSSTSTAK